MSNKIALDALKPCPFCGGDVMHRHALWPSDGDTDSVIHAQGSTCGMGCFSIGTADQGVSVAAAWNARAAIAALQAEPQPEADMFWDSDDGESFGHSIQDLIAERDVGEVVTVDRAMRLPSIKVRVISGETDEDDNTWEEVIPSTPPKD